MSMNEILKKMYELIESHSDLSYCIEHGIKSKLADFKEKNKDIPLEELKHELMAFSFEERFEDQENENPLGKSFYWPTFISYGADGQYVSSFPQKSDITITERLSYWSERIRNTKNPILKCRYSGLCWEFFNEGENRIEFARGFVDSVIDLSNKIKDSSLSTLMDNKLRQALSLSIKIQDEDRKNKVVDSIINYEKVSAVDDLCGTWGISFDSLIREENFSNKINLPKEQEDWIINELDRRLKKFSKQDEKVDYTMLFEAAAHRLLYYYKLKGKTDKLKNIALKLKDHTIFASKKYTGMVKSTRLSKLKGILNQYGFSVEASSIDHMIMESEKESLNDLKRYEVKTAVSQDRLLKIRQSLDRLSLNDALVWITLKSILNKDSCEKIVKELIQKNHLKFFVKNIKIDEFGREVASIRPITEKGGLEDHISSQAAESTNLNLAFMHYTLTYLKESKDLKSEAIINHLLRSPFFEDNRKEIFSSGVNDFFKENYIASSLTLIHEIERIIRSIVSYAGGVTRKGDGDLIGLGSLIKNKKFQSLFKDHYLKNIPYYLENALVDGRGINLRDKICHGDFSRFFLNEATSLLIVHILMLLASLQIIRNNEPSSDKQDPDEKSKNLEQGKKTK